MDRVSQSKHMPFYILVAIQKSNRRCFRRQNLNYNDIIPLLSHAIIVYLCCLFWCWLCSIFYFMGMHAALAHSPNDQFHVHFGVGLCFFFARFFLSVSVNFNCFCWSSTNKMQVLKSIDKPLHAQFSNNDVRSSKWMKMNDNKKK